MQVGRMFEMIFLLLRRETVTAGELAERFEVSTRTIYRDLEALSAAGVPVYAARGKGGGIRILPGFVLDRSMLSEQEQSGILSALQGLQAAGDQGADRMLDKLSGLFRRSEPSWISVDFSAWGSDRALFDGLKRAILDKLVVSFQYYGADGGAGVRTVEPLQLAFKGRTWYLHAWCRDREDLRLFRLSRMRDLSLLELHFDRAFAPIPEEGNWGSQDWQTVRLRLDGGAVHRVYDEFDPARIVANADGSYTAESEMPLDSWVVGYVLSFGGAASVLGPAALRERVRQAALLAAEAQNRAEQEAEGGQI